MLKPALLFFILTIVKIRTIKCEIEGKVVDGDYTTIKSFPHSVFLNVECYASWICGASILNQRLLLTAAHCVYNPSTLTSCKVGRGKNNVIEAYLGHEDLTQVQITRMVKEVITHADYDDMSIENDIAIVMVRENIPLSETIQRVIINNDWIFKRRHGFVAGWGIVNETAPNSRTMKLVAVNQKVRSQKTCALSGNLSPGMFCAGSTEAEDPHPSAGDSGSAFVINDYQQIGLVSFRVNSYPALMIYTNVTYYYKWIKQNSEELYCGNVHN